VEFNHTLACSKVGSGTGFITVTTSAELYDETSAFGRRVRMIHNCTRPLRVCNMSVSVLSVAHDRDIMFTTDATVAMGSLLKDPYVAPVHPSPIFPHLSVVRVSDSLGHPPTNTVDVVLVLFRRDHCRMSRACKHVRVA
jgi:hypothetical protein